MDSIAAFGGAVALLLAKDFATAFASEVGRGAAVVTKQTLGRLRGRLRGKPAISEAIDRLQAAPTDERRQAALAELITAELREEPSFAADVRAILDELGHTVEVGSADQPVGFRNSVVAAEQPESGSDTIGQ